MPTKSKPRGLFSYLSELLLPEASADWITKGDTGKQVLDLGLEHPVYGAAIKAASKVPGGEITLGQDKANRSLGSTQWDDKTSPGKAQIAVSPDFFENDLLNRTSKYQLGVHAVPTTIPRTLAHESGHYLLRNRWSREFPELAEPVRRVKGDQPTEEFLVDLIAANPTDEELMSLISSKWWRRIKKAPKLRELLDTVLGDESAEFVGPKAPPKVQNKK